MDVIDKHLATAALDDKYEASIQAALVVGKRHLNKYYNMTDHSELYRIAMGTWFYWKIRYINGLDRTIQVLHPSHKLDYFRSAGWEDKWIKTAKDIVRTEFERGYAGMGVKDSGDDSVCNIYSYLN